MPDDELQKWIAEFLDETALRTAPLEDGEEVEWGADWEPLPDDVGWEFFLPLLFWRYVRDLIVADRAALEPSAGRPFQALSDEMLDDLAAALDSAAREGAFGNDAITDALCAEFVARDRMMPVAYSDDRLSPDEWKRWLDGI